MTTQQKDWQASLKLAQTALTKIDKEKYPKRYKIQEELVDTLQYNDNMRIRAEKAEKEAKAPKPEKVEETPKKPAESETPKNDFSPKDYLALSQAGVPADDLDEVTDYAKYKGITIAEALKASYIQTTLKEKAEERKTAEATNTGGGRRGQDKISGKRLLDKFKSGQELPETDAEIAKLVESQLKEKLENSR